MSDTESQILTLKKYLESEQPDDKILRALKRLHNFSMTVELLQNTGIGKAVNQFRKHDHPIGPFAKALVNKWKQDVAKIIAESAESEYNDHNDSKPAETSRKRSASPDEHVREKYARNDYDSESPSPVKTGKSKFSFEEYKRGEHKNRDKESVNSRDGNKIDYDVEKSSVSKVKSQSERDRRRDSSRDKHKYEKHSKEKSQEKTKDNAERSKEGEGGENSGYHADSRMKSKHVDSAREGSKDSESLRDKSKYSEGSQEKTKDNHDSREKSKYGDDLREKSKHSEGSREKSKHDGSREKSKHGDSSREKSKHSDSSREKSKHSDGSLEKSKHIDSSREKSKHSDGSREKSKRSDSSREKSKHSDSSREKSKHSDGSREKSKLSDKSRERNHNRESSERQQGEKREDNSRETSRHSDHEFRRRGSINDNDDVDELPNDFMPTTSEQSSESGAEGRVRKKKNTERKSTLPQFHVPAPQRQIGLQEVDILASLPQTVTNYKPLPHVNPNSPSKRRVTDEEIGTKKHSRSALYSGKKTRVVTRVPRLFDACMDVLLDNIDEITCVGGTPYFVLKPVLLKCTPQQLYNLEHYNPHFLEDSDELWADHCKKDFRGRERNMDDCESWRELYLRLYEEREKKLRALTANISAQHSALKDAGRKTKLAFVETIAKPPREVLRKQRLHGTGGPVHKTVDPLEKLSSRGGQPGKSSIRAPIMKNQVTNHIVAPPAVKIAAKKPTTAPMMARTMKMMKKMRR